MTKSISLPDLPTDKEFEEYVAAFLQSAGYFIERSMIDRSEEEILELDIIQTEYSNNSHPIENLIEVKSGGWGFSDIFKIVGWGNYLKLDNISLVVCKDKPTQDFYEKKAKDIGVEIIFHPNNNKNLDHSKLLTQHSIDPIDVAVWRFSYWLERSILQRLKNKKKSQSQFKSYKALDEYYHTVNSAIFFSKNIFNRIEKLYDTFKTYPNISAKLGNELVGNNFDDEHDQIPANIFKKTYYNKEFTDLNISTFVEHRARLAILKSAVDFTLFEKHGFSERVKSEVEFMGHKFSLKSLLPDSFLVGLDHIKNDKYFHLYPIFWQQFLWLFGGFILEDYIDSEYKLLSIKSGIPVSEIDNAFSSYGKIFPLSGGWFINGSANSKIKIMKLSSVPFMGIGANYRRLIYAENAKFENLNLTGSYTRSDLISWNNQVIEILS